MATISLIGWSAGLIELWSVDYYYHYPIFTCNLYFPWFTYTANRVMMLPFDVTYLSLYARFNKMKGPVGKASLICGGKETHDAKILQIGDGGDSVHFKAKPVVPKKPREDEDLEKGGGGQVVNRMRRGRV
ncbi:hypothetical protein OsI_05179 [Oryza sativa Indica Group]|uniref:Uncharacterized protein n=1 Tax=Oryza sativa subsp. indica TaxID=39946 RepID=B8A949_ORYSI|nr:hypothetical protein OsI_05179 [Oryza sativa Indica Group]